MEKFFVHRILEIVLVVAVVVAAATPIIIKENKNNYYHHCHHHQIDHNNDNLTIMIMFQTCFNFSGSDIGDVQYFACFGC